MIAIVRACPFFSLVEEPKPSQGLLSKRVFARVQELHLELVVTHSAQLATFYAVSERRYTRAAFSCFVARFRLRLSGTGFGSCILRNNTNSDFPIE